MVVRGCVVLASLVGALLLPHISAIPVHDAGGLDAVCSRWQVPLLLSMCACAYFRNFEADLNVVIHGIAACR